MEKLHHPWFNVLHHRVVQLPPISAPQTMSTVWLCSPPRATKNTVTADLSPAASTWLSTTPSPWSARTAAPAAPSASSWSLTYRSTWPGTPGRNPTLACFVARALCARASWTFTATCTPERGPSAAPCVTDASPIPAILRGTRKSSTELENQTSHNTAAPKF